MESRLQRIWTIVAAAAALQALVWVITRAGGFEATTGLVLQRTIAWTTILILAVAASRRLGRLSTRIEQHQQAHQITLVQLNQLETQNEILQVIARTPDVALAFQALARRLARIVPCDRVGLALLKEGAQQFQTFMARVAEEERRIRPRPELELSMERSVVGQVVREREPLVVDDLAALAPDYYDANVLQSAGFNSALFVPLLSKGRAVGTINLVSRNREAFRLEDAKALESIAEILAVAYIAQHAQMALARFRTVEAMSDLTLSIANDINGALQIIIGHCDLLERSYPDPTLQRDLATVVRQAQRISALLEKMRAAAAERLKEVAASVNQAGIPTSPEGLVEEEPT
jgi:transcriptional regulator with GAF, ATPase, and Fis domain